MCDTKPISRIKNLLDLEDENRVSLPISRKNKRRFVKMNFKRKNAEEKLEYKLYEIEYSERVTYGRLKK